MGININKILKESESLLEQWDLLSEGLDNPSKFRLIPELKGLKSWGEAGISDLEFDPQKWKKFIKRGRGKEVYFKDVYMVIFPNAVMSTYSYFQKEGYGKRVGIQGDKAAVKRVFNNIINNADAVGSVNPKENYLFSVPSDYFDQFPEMQLANKIDSVVKFKQRIEDTIKLAKEIDSAMNTKYEKTLSSIVSEIDKTMKKMGA